MKAPIRLAIGALPLLLLLTACWSGELFYSANELVAPIPAGIYQSEPNSSSEPKLLRVTIRPDGYTAFAEPDRETSIAGFAQLPDSEGRFVVWFREEDKDEHTLWYGLLEKRGAEYFLTLPICKETRSLAEAVGAQFVPDPKVPICRFPDRASLEQGLRRLAVEGTAEWVRLTPARKDDN